MSGRFSESWCDMDIPEFLTDEHRVLHHECGPDEKLKLVCLLDYFQDIAARHADLLGVGMLRLQEQQLLWVLSRLKLRIRRSPVLGERVRVLTYPTGLNRLFATRQYQLLDEAGNQLVIGTSFWLVLDRVRFHPVKPFHMLADFVGLNPEKERFYPELDKIPEPETVPPRLCEYMVRASHIDLNKHLNNAFVGGYVTDVLGILTNGFLTPSELQINFLHSGALNDSIHCGGTISDSGEFYVDGRNSDGSQLYFQAEGNL
ncbi:MAG: Acyl-ACP thioesterase [Lentisphaerae bacterium ADurb.Bin242]|nr:MAG: Acyl-ACP thioesterase [Lentisphaerae bacterium ADurb.Bin242]